MSVAVLPRVTPRSQFNDPSTTQDSVNCTPTAYVMLLELATGIRMLPGQFRALQSDTEGGISIPDGARAWHRATSAQLDWAAPNDGTPIPETRHGDGLTPDQLWALFEQDKGVVIQGLYLVFEQAGISLQPGFRDPHAVYADAVRTTIRRQVYILDPLGRGDYDGQWVDWSTVVHYGQALGRGDLIYAAWASDGTPQEDPMLSPGDDINYGWESYTLDNDHTVYCIGGPRRDDGSTDSDLRLCFAGSGSPVVTFVSRDRLTNGKALAGSDALFAAITSGRIGADQKHTVTLSVDGQKKAEVIV